MINTICKLSLILFLLGGGVLTRASTVSEQNATGGPLIPSALNGLLPGIHPGMTIPEVESVLAAAYPKVAGRMSDWDGMTGYIDYRLDDRYSLSVASINRADGKKVVQVVGGGDILFYIYDWPSKNRIEVQQYVWDEKQSKKAVTK